MDVSDVSKDIDVYQPVDDDFVYSVWFCGFSGADFMATLWEHDGEARFSYRVRIHKDDKVFDSADEKHWRVGHGELDAVDAIRDSIDAVLANVQRMFPRDSIVDNAERIDVGGSVSDMIDKISSRPWCNIRKLERQ